MALVAAVVAGLVWLAACTGDAGRRGAESPPPAASGPTTTPGSAPGGEAHPRGGSARVGVWGEPDPDAPTLGGAAVRTLVLPQLFVAGPDGRWQASLVAPGSDRTAGDGRSARFRLRPGAVWSDGTPISADDLRRSADPRFVAGVDGPAADAGITVRFTQALPGWRRLWSGTEVVTAPRPQVWGGPFELAAYVPGLEAVLRANQRWYGGRAFLDEVRMVLVPDPVVARWLLATGGLDVVMPPVATVRTRQLEALPGVSVATGPPAGSGGWWVGLLLRADGLARAQRAAVVASVDRRAFAGTLLRDEVEVLDSLGGAGTWSGVGPGPTGALRGATVDLIGVADDPVLETLHRSMFKRVEPGGGRLELRRGEQARVEGWVAEGSYQAALVAQFDPAVVCWTCRWAAVDERLSRAADAGDAAAVGALEARLRDEALVLPLWRPVPVVAWRHGLGGVRASAFALSGAWNAWEWWWDA